jgi:putative ABC transport system substrate-binding protein
MRRIGLAVVLALSLFAATLTANAQRVNAFRVGVVLQGGAYSPAVDGLRAGLKKLGLEEGQHLLLSVRDGKGDLKSVEAAARSLEEEKVDLIYTVTSSVTLATKRATTRVPIVFYVGSDPVVDGLVESYRRPGGRFTGIHGQLTDLVAKRLELLKEMLPGLRKAVTFFNPENPVAQRSIKIARDAARMLNVTLVERPVVSVEALRTALRALRPGEVDALVSVSDAMVNSQSDFIVDVAKTKKLPTMLQYEEPARRASGALASYGEHPHGW